MSDTITKAKASRHRSTRRVVKIVPFKRRAVRLLAMTWSGIVLSTASAHATELDFGSSANDAESIDSSQHTALGSESISEQALPGDEALGVEHETRQVSNTAGLDSIVAQAWTMIGIPYRWGGNDPEEGLDCSGFVRYVYHKATGMLLPRQSAQISKEGSAVAQPALHPGDLVFFNTSRGRATHVGIYLGDEQFIHAPATGSFIRVESMTSRYWASRYYGARRFVGTNDAALKRST
jgi:cell wall-associated NlpC family hydrolase